VILPVPNLALRRHPLSRGSTYTPKLSVRRRFLERLRADKLGLAQQGLVDGLDRGAR
jgi:hypothetical protein